MEKRPKTYKIETDVARIASSREDKMKSEKRSEEEQDRRYWCEKELPG